MQTEIEIQNYLKLHYPHWDQDNLEYFTDLLLDLLSFDPTATLQRAYIDIGLSQRTNPHDINDNIAVIKINTQIHYLNAIRAHLDTVLLPYMGEGIDAYALCYSFDTLLITLDLSY